MSGVATSRDGIPLAFEVHGAGTPTLVLVHGWSCDRSYWSRQLRPLAARYQTMAVDLAGHGKSGAGRQAWTMAAFGEDVVAVAEQLDLGELVLVGHSMGGDVIVEAALRLGERVAGLVWVDTYGTLGEPPTDEEVEAFVAPFREDFATATRALVRRLFRRRRDRNSAPRRWWPGGAPLAGSKPDGARRREDQKGARLRWRTPWWLVVAGKGFEPSTSGL
jgi:pimeloyl-ACP methyl ester carboxylesterase